MPGPSVPFAAATEPDAPTDGGAKRGVPSGSRRGCAATTRTTPTMRISHEAIYQGLYIPDRGGLSREHVAYLSRRSSSAWAKNADAVFRISFARRSSAFSWRSRASTAA